MKSIMKEMVGGCCVCSDERGWPENPLVYCDGQGCTVAVHQACYGIVTVPTGPWYCRKCESQERSARVRCELCPSKDGALKRTDNTGWAHVVCALYIPEVRFGNVTTMEPIILQLIPTERFNKICYICEELGKGGRSTVGACMQCNKSGCKQQFHVTCAQALGLLCEEAGNYLDNVKYCGYCQHHYSKLKKGGNVKTIPPYKPIPTDNHSSDSSPEKEAEAAVVATKSSQPQTTSSSSSSRKSKSSSSNSKSSSSSSKSSTSTSKSSSSSANSHQKTVHNSSSSNKNISNVEKSSSKNFSSAKSAAKNTESEVTNSVNAQIESDSKSVDKSSERSTPSSKDSSVATKFSNSNFSDSATPVSDSVFGDNRSDSNLSSSSAKDNISKSSSKKRKAGSRTPTPNSVAPVETDKSVVNAVSVTQNSVGVSQGATTTPTVTNAAQDRRDSIGIPEVIEKTKKAKIEHPQPAPIPPPHHTITTPRTTSSPSVPIEPPPVVSDVPPPAPPPVLATTASVVQQPNSLVVSVPLASTSLSPIQQQQGVPHGPLPSVAVQHQLYSHLPPRTPPLNATNGPTESALGISVSLDSTMVSSETNDGGLKITYEKQPTMNSSSLSRLATDNASSPVVPEEVPAKRSRSQSADKTEKMGRPKKRGSNGVTTVSGPATGAGKRVSRSQHATPPPTTQPGAFSSVSQQQTTPQPPPPQQQQPQQVVKESPPSSPSDESNSVGSGRRTKGRKSAPATITSVTSSSSNTPTVPKPETKDMKDIKVFQNGVHAPHMLGNQLNPNSNMAQKMSDHLNSELEAHSIFNAAENSTNLVGPQLHSRVIASVRSNTSASNASSSSGFSSMLGGVGGGAVPQTLDQLLERQWEQGSQFLMEQAQHFDIASLLSCLHQLRAENLRLEEHVNSLLQRRDHLLAVNARLAIPLTNQQPVAAPSQPHTLNNLHPSVTASHGDVPRSRHSSGSGYAGHNTGAGAPPLENGLPLDGAAYPHQHRSPASSQPQPSPTIRHSPASSNYPSTSSHGIVRSGSVSDGNSRSSQRSQSQSSHSSYPQYQGQMPGVTPLQQPQMVMRRDTDVHHQMPSSKPS